MLIINLTALVAMEVKTLALIMISTSLQSSSNFIYQDLCAGWDSWRSPGPYWPDGACTRHADY